MKPVIVAVHCAAALVSISAHAVEIDAAAFVAAHNKWRAKAGVTEKLGLLASPRGGGAGLGR